MNSKLIVGLVIIILLVLLGLSLLKSEEINSLTTNNKDQDKIKVSTSIYPLYFFASQIGSEKADVKNITPSGTEPHDYEPTAQDIARVESSNILILNGGVEGWANKVSDNIKEKDILIVIAGEGLFNKLIEGDGEKLPDPHIWLDPNLAKIESQKITQGYIKVDPTNAAYYQENEKILGDKFDQLDQKFKQGLQNCESRDIVTSHAAFAYLASAYNLNQISIAGVSSDEEPSSQQLVEVAKIAKERNIKYIFFESLVSPKLSETIAQEIGAKTLVLDPLEGISDDDIKQGKNYFTVMEENLKNLQIALQCNQ